MRWANFVVVAESLWLSWLPGHAGALPNETFLARRQVPPTSTYGSVVYRGDRRSPRQIRDAGGFRPQGDGWATYGPSYDLDRHYRAGPNGCGLEGSQVAGFVFRTAYVSVAQDRSTAETYGDWLYEIIATPNILDADFAETEVCALGGIHWAQVRRYTRMVMRGGVNVVDEQGWMDNPEYNAELYERGPDASRCRVNDDFPPEFTGAPNSDSDSDSDEDMSEGGSQRYLIGVADRFMDRTDGIYELFGQFPPVFRTYAPRDDIPGPSDPPPQPEPESSDAQAAAMLNYVDALPNVGEALRNLLGDVDRSACPAFTGHGSPFKRSDGLGVGLAARKASRKQGCCKLLADFRSKAEKKHGAKHVDVQNSDKCVLRSPLKIKVQLSGDGSAGSWDRLFLEIGQNPRYENSQPHYLLKEGPDAGDLMSLDVDLADAYTMHAVTINDIKHVRLVSRWNNGKVASNELKLQSITITAKCAESSKVAEIHKTVDAWFTNWGLDLKPADWSWKRDCDRFTEIKFKWLLSSAPDAGTWDDLRLGFGRDHQATPHDIWIASSPALGDWAEMKIPLKEAYGSASVPIEKVDYLRVYSTTRWPDSSLDWWKFGGIHFTAQCEGFDKPVILDKYGYDYNWHSRTGGGIDMPIAVGDWRWEDGNIQSRHPFPREEL